MERRCNVDASPQVGVLMAKIGQYIDYQSLMPKMRHFARTPPLSRGERGACPNDPAFAGSGGGEGAQLSHRGNLPTPLWDPVFSNTPLTRQPLPFDTLSMPFRRVDGWTYTRTPNLSISQARSSASRPADCVTITNCHPEFISGSRNPLILLDAETSSA